jgi:hypothetical protein
MWAHVQIDKPHALRFQNLYRLRCLHVARGMRVLTPRGRISRRALPQITRLMRPELGPVKEPKLPTKLAVPVNDVLVEVP